MPNLVKATTQQCPFCFKTGEVEVNSYDYLRYLDGTRLIQDAMPNTSADVREQIITGIHPECWKACMDSDD